MTTKRSRSLSSAAADSNAPQNGIASLLSPKAQGKRRVTTSSPPPHVGAPPNRLIIAIDLDSFYVSASRLLDPSLIGQPVGVKQKGLLATCSYEARALGVRKLSTVRDALRRCPALILVDGEDLTWYRRLSAKVWRLVRGVVGPWDGKVEKLGLDELFVDVTEMVDAHIRGREEGKTREDAGRVFFQVAPDSEPEAGFWYDTLGKPIGHVLPLDSHASSSEDTPSSTYRSRLILTTHLALHLRNLIHSQIGLTTSAGIAHNKVLAKLVSSRHKPAKQTLFLPRSAEDVVRFLDDEADVRAIMGFGGAIVSKMRESLGATSSEAAANDDASPPLSVSLARKAFPLAHLTTLFGPRLGIRLHGLLRGLDDEEVAPTPLYPLQISIEDTYRGLKGQEVVAEQMRLLAASLLRRLEGELMGSGAGMLSSEPGKAEQMEKQDDRGKWQRHDMPLFLPGEQGNITGKEAPISDQKVIVRCYRERESDPSESSTWQRYPLTVRLSIRHGWGKRTSRSTAMPLDIFDVRTLSRRERAERLAGVLMGLLLRGGPGQGQGQGQISGEALLGGEGLNLINIAALNLATRRPAAQPLRTFFDAGGGGAARQKRDSVDMETLLQLPEDIRREVAAQYGIVLEEQEAVVGAEQESRLDTGCEEDEDDALWDDLPPIPAMDPSSPANIASSSLVCSHCGVAEAPWLQHDHARWPIYGVPAVLLGSATASEGSGA
ncbi:DNA/RNA polymerase [Jaminaea rosea]|uniref:DNA/RNA polymerase n=1 Tax=Jaminaea rosea TaxID=1569628 RepID=A0A316UWL1_9BASI|nr:DNA/RNA polymerase [Jaminaea rosea]PWN27505.1 DNA/RNA polymerase [Jaminaea rosea]